VTSPTPQNRPFRKRHLLQSGLLFVVLAALGHFAVDTERNRLEQELRRQVTWDAFNYVSRLESVLHANVFLANGLFTLLAAVPDATDAQLQSGLKALAMEGRHVRNVGLAPDNRLKFVYPVKGNLAAIGLYYPDIPEQWPSVKKAMEIRSTVLAGPILLRQGGTGLISRTPVFLEDGRYWGMLSLVLDADTLFKDVGLAAEVNHIRYALRGKDGMGDQGEVFFGPSDLFKSDAIKIPFDVPGGAWVIAALPRDGWNTEQGFLYALESAALLLALALAFGFYAMQRARMRILVSERRMRAFMETARDAVIVINSKGTILEFNHAAERLFDYPASELLGTSLNRLMPDAEAQEHDKYVQGSHLTGVKRMAGGREIVGKRRDGETFPAEITVGNMLIGTERVFVGVVRDITKRKEYENKLLELATTDGLTKVLNRRAFLEEGNTLHQLALRHQRPLSFMMLDADNFKKINDTYGHHTGDKVLALLAHVARDCLRTTDKLGRIGGEEFAVLMPETDLAKGLAVCERLLQSIRETEVTTDAGESLKFTVSIGIATMETDSRGIDTLMRQADAALYRAKAEGRNRCCQAGTEDLD